jgi:hypothetical protein
MQNIVDYLTDYLSIFTRGSYVGGDLSDPVKGFIERVDFKSVLEYYYHNDDKKLLELNLIEDKKEEFKKDQVELVTKMLEKVDSYTKTGISGISKISQLGGSKNGYWPILAVAATLVDGSSAPVVAPAAAPASTAPPPLAETVVAPPKTVAVTNALPSDLLNLILRYMSETDNDIINEIEKLITVDKVKTDMSNKKKIDELYKEIEKSTLKFNKTSISDLAIHLNVLGDEIDVLKTEISDLRLIVLDKSE